MLAKKKRDRNAKVAAFHAAIRRRWKKVGYVSVDHFSAACVKGDDTATAEFQRIFCEAAKDPAAIGGERMGRIAEALFCNPRFDQMRDGGIVVLGQYPDHVERAKASLDALLAHADSFLLVRIAALLDSERRKHVEQMRDREARKQAEKIAS